ncbi:MAG TPA: ribosome maturation factor RimM [Bacteroidales bacterium]|jgi:16S rRNA processing protein RimM|nr:16S rRNA processing protein RimM [Bacteroidales bacterium]OQB62551.1 MAG: Ribosome maturation factor RimM [Bacteroidetes bacterium ADurb.Bin145]NMD03782.1 16S rRNA processing protein RimM [Bacteroidales bacterium]HOU01233.1 ribosome maturation factor RimM [Bacteroidales bacterium]HQG64016.1 ribosome maturation factor RimM [Bacteroidales bacterium]
MAYKADILLGHIIKLHGHKGEVIIKLGNDFRNKLPVLEWVFLEIEGKPVPFLISGSEYSGSDTLLLRFEGYDSSEKVKEFLNCKVFLTQKTTGITKSRDPENILGFKIHTIDNKLIGKVTGITENPGQLLLNVDTGSGNTVLIPLHENLISRIDRRRKIITMDLPEGLTELN